MIRHTNFITFGGNTQRNNPNIKGTNTSLIPKHPDIKQLSSNPISVFPGKDLEEKLLVGSTVFLAGMAGFLAFKDKLPTASKLNDVDFQPPIATQQHNITIVDTRAQKVVFPADENNDVEAYIAETPSTSIPSPTELLDTPEEKPVNKWKPTPYRNIMPLEATETIANKANEFFEITRVVIPEKLSENILLEAEKYLGMSQDQLPDRMVDQPNYNCAYFVNEILFDILGFYPWEDSNLNYKIKGWAEKSGLKTKDSSQIKPGDVVLFKKHMLIAKTAPDENGNYLSIEANAHGNGAVTSENRNIHREAYKFDYVIQFSDVSVKDIQELYKAYGIDVRVVNTQGEVIN